MRSALPTTLAVLALAALVACGMPGAPQPPSLELPRAVHNLQATRKGDKVTLTWTTPHETTDHKRIKHLGLTRVCRAVDVVDPVKCFETLSTVPAAQTPLGGTLTFTDVLPKELEEKHALGFADYSVQVENSYGRSASLSNHVMVPLASAPLPATQLSARVTPEGVEVSAAFERPVLPVGTETYHLYRRLQGATQIVNVATAASYTPGGRGSGLLTFLDRTAEWEKTYLYTIAGVTTVDVLGKEESIVGDDSAQIEVFVHDVFPPAVPTGLQAVSAGTPQQPFIDLSWTPNTESDLAGYNVYRHEEGTEVKINRELVKVPAYRDTNVQVGHRYFYAVTAVDVRGNESSKSAESSEVVER